jgi:iron complex outermembrane receptor protein
LPSALAGDQLPFSPEFGANIAGTFTLPTPEDLGKIELTAAYRYSSSYSTASSNSGGQRASAVSQLDLNIDWRNVGGHQVDLGVFATNVTNQFTQTLVQPLYNNFGFDTRYIGMPRMIGARLRARFGANN